MSRRRDRHGLQVARGERYALIPREVLESEAYRALPAWTVVVLLALAVQYYGRRNGSLALPWAEAQRLGVRYQWQLYGALQILEAADLILCTRRGHLAGGRKRATLWALTWRSIDEPATGVTYDGTLSMTLQPSHAWARWTRPDDWEQRVRMIGRKAHGRLAHECPYPARSISTRGEWTTPPVGSDEPLHHSTRGERKRSSITPPVVETSKISAQGTVSDGWDLAFRLRNPALQLTAVVWLLIAAGVRP